MKLRMLLLTIAAVVAACSSTTTQQGTGGAGTGGGNPCAGLGCAVFPGTLTLQVVGPMNQPVMDPVFKENGATLPASCESDAGVPIADAGPCASWVFTQLPLGKHTIVVSAPGFGSGSVTVTIEGPSGCCGQGPAVMDTVTLTPSPADAGSD